MIPFSELSGGKASSAGVRQAEQALGTSRRHRLLGRLSAAAAEAVVHRHGPPTAGDPDHDHQPRETAWTPKLPITVTESLAVSDDGVPVDVTAPPASEVTAGGICQANADGFNCESPSSPS